MSADPFITRTRTSIREIAGEPGVHAKYTDARLLTYIEQAYSHIITELNRLSANPVVVTYDITLNSDLRTYLLPPTVFRVVKMEMRDASGNIAWDEFPGSRYNPSGHGVALVGNTINFSYDPTGTYTFRVHYLPSGCVRLHYGSITSDASIVNNTTTDTCTIVLPASPTAGTLDIRPNAYAGSILRILGATSHDYVQERIITAYDVTTRTATVAPAFTTALLPSVGGGGAITYEIAPLFDQAVDLAVATYVARTLVALDGDKARMATLTQLWREQIADLISQGKWMNGLTEGIKRDSMFRRGGFAVASITNLAPERARVM